MRVKSSGMDRGLANARPPGSAKFANAPPPGTDKASKCPAVAWGRGGGWAQVELTDAQNRKANISLRFQSLSIKRGYFTVNCFKLACLTSHSLSLS